MYREQRTVGIILARKGSRGVPGKNVRPLAGRPMVSWTIADARQSSLLDHLVCSTNDEEVMAVCKREEVEVVRRPEPLCDDLAPVDPALRHALDDLESRGLRFDLCLALYACVPVRAPGVIDRSIRALIDSGRDCLITVANVGKMNPYWMFKEADGKLVQYLPSTAHRRQDLPKFFICDGAVLACRTASLRTPRPRSHLYSSYGETVEFLRQEPLDTVDIDSELDLAVAGAVLATRLKP